MAKNTFLDFDTSAAGNTDVAGISILGTAAVTNFDNAFRELMAILRADLDNGVVYASKTGAYTAVANDNNATHRFTDAGTVTLTAAATLASGWHYTVIADGGARTIDPDGTEEINSATTLVIADGESAIIICTGTAFEAIIIPTGGAEPYVNVASAATVDLGAVGSTAVNITGTTGVSSFGTSAADGAEILVRFAAVLTLTAGANLILPTGHTSWDTTAGETFLFKKEGASVWRGLFGPLVVASQAAAEAGTNNGAYMTALRTKQAALALLNASGSAPVYACRAWVNFNGTGTVAIRASGNVSSITDNGTGNYTVNFTTAMPDANYCVVADANANTYTVQSAGVPDYNSYATGSVIVRTGNTISGAAADMSHVNCAVFR